MGVVIPGNRGVSVTQYAVMKLPEKYVVNTFDTDVVRISTTSNDASYEPIYLVPLPFDKPDNITASDITHNGFTLSWDAVDFASNYYLDISLSSTFSTYVTGYRNKIVGSNNSIVVDGLDDLTTYYVRLKATTGRMTSVYSETVAVTTLLSTLFDYLLPCYIQNVERDIMLPTVDQTRYKIVSHNSTLKTIVLDQDLPVELEEVGTDWEDRWIIQSIPGSLAYISHVDFPTRTITYSYLKNVLNIGTNVSFMNPYRCWVQDPVNWMIERNAVWGNTFVGAGPIWKHSDGDYRFIVNGYTQGVGNKSVLFKSSDMKSWTNVGGGNTYRYASGVHPFDEWWCVESKTHSPLGSAVKIRSGVYQDQYAIACIGRDAVGACHSAVVIVDEDFNILHMPTDPLVIPGYPLPDVNYLNLTYGLFYYQNKLYANVHYRNNSTNPASYSSLLCELDDWVDPTITNVELLLQTPQADSIYNSNAFVSAYIEYNGILYAVTIFDPANTFPDTPLANNFEMGIMYKVDGVWTTHPQSPLIINPVAADNVWAGTYWCSDSMGGGTFYYEGDTLHYITAMKSGTDSYRIGRLALTLPA